MNLRQDLSEFRNFAGEVFQAAVRSATIRLDPLTYFPPARKLGPRLQHPEWIRRSGRSEIRVLHLRGFIAPKTAALYNYLGRHTTAVGMTTEEPPLNWWKYHLGSLESTLIALERLIDERGIDVIVCHSRGAILGLWLAIRTGIPVFAMAPPLHRIPAQDLLANVARFYLAPDFRKLWKVDALVERLQTPPAVPMLIVSGQKDTVAPYSACYIEGIPHHCVPGNHHTMLEKPATVRAFIEFVRHHIVQYPWAA